MSMQQALEGTAVWIHTEVLMPDYGNKKVQVQVRIKEDSIANSFLVIGSPPQDCCFIPITAELNVNNEGDTLMIQFTSYDKIVIILKYEDFIQLELMVSHFVKSSLYNTTPDKFKQENLAFLKKVSSKEREMNQKNILRQGHASTALSPITLDQGAKDIWKKRTINSNTQFYMKSVPVRFSFLTWNVASREPNQDVLNDLSKVFRVPAASSDIIVIAFEEIEMSMKSVVTGSSHLTDRWTELIGVAQSRIASDSFEIVSKESLGGVYLACLVRKGLKIQPVFKPIQTIKLGANGMLANKAAVIAQFTVGEASFVAVGCHLAPHDQNWEQRNQQWHEIAQIVGDKVDYFIFMGDLNYRIVLTYEQVIEHVNAKNIGELYKHDQLHQTQQNDNVIGQFKENEIKFNPTFKYDKNCDVYDTSPKHRIPSWTDRILVKTNKPRMSVGLKDTLTIETDAAQHFMTDTSHFKTCCFQAFQQICLNYPQPPENVCYRALGSTFSDHRPVHSAFKFYVPILDEDRKGLLDEIITAKYEEMKEYSKPIVQASPNIVKFQPNSVASVILTNKSLVWAHWKVKSTSLKVEPREGLIYANESIEVLITLGDSAPNASLMFDVSHGSAFTVKFTTEELPEFLSRTLSETVPIQTQMDIQHRPRVGTGMVPKK